MLSLGKDQTGCFQVLGFLLENEIKVHEDCRIVRKLDESKELEQLG